MIILTVTSTETSSGGNRLIGATVAGAPEIDTPAGRIIPDEVSAAFRDGALRWLQVAGPATGSPHLRANWTFRIASDPAVADLAADLSALLLPLTRKDPMDFQFDNHEITDRRICVARASYLAGECTPETGINDLMQEGVLPRERAAALLARPMAPERVMQYIAQDVTEGQIDAQIAKVQA